MNKYTVFFNKVKCVFLWFKGWDLFYVPQNKSDNFCLTVELNCINHDAIVTNPAGHLFSSFHISLGSLQSRSGQWTGRAQCLQISWSPLHKWWLTMIYLSVLSFAHREHRRNLTKDVEGPMIETDWTNERFFQKDSKTKNWS